MTSCTIGLDDTSSGRAAFDWVKSLPLDARDVVKVVTVTEFFGEASGSARRRLVDAAAALRREHPGVIGSHRDRMLRSMATGWLPERIAVASTVPTVVVPDDWNRFDGDGDVVVGIDTIDEANAAVVGARFAEVFGRSLQLVSARPIPVGAVVAGGRTGAVGLAQMRPQDAELLEAVMDRVRTRYPAVHVRAEAVDGDPIDVIAAAATDALIVFIGREHHTAAGGALFGSVGMNLIHGSRTPVCVVPTA